MTPNIKSSFEGYKYPTLRDDPLHDPYDWLKGKRIDDNTDGLWRIHDKLYDLKSFKSIHPGGKSWLDLTEGTDCTEIFESHHISTTPAKMLEKYFVRDATTPRNSPYTFKEDGFYRTLKKEVAEALKKIPPGLDKKSERMADAMVISSFIMATVALYFRSYVLSMVAGYFVTSVVIIGHNFFHKKDNFRMHYIGFGFLSAIEWRISHTLSHHTYTNTVGDFEISSFEPFFEYLPKDKNWRAKYASWIYTPLIFVLYFFFNFFKRLHLASLRGLTKDWWSMFTPFSILLVMQLATGAPILTAFKYWLVLMAFASFHFLLVALTGAHHHNQIFHDGDEPYFNDERDWGILQLDAIIEQKEYGKTDYLVLTNFGDHTMHHWFPTLDHAKLKYLQPVAEKVCKDFKIKIRRMSIFKLFKGQFKQLARHTPTTPEFRWKID